MLRDLGKASFDAVRILNSKFRGLMLKIVNSDVSPGLEKSSELRHGAEDSRGRMHRINYESAIARSSGSSSLLGFWICGFASLHPEPLRFVRFAHLLPPHLRNLRNLRTSLCFSLPPASLLPKTFSHLPA